MAIKFNITSLTIEQLKELQADIATLMDSTAKQESEAKLRKDLKKLADIKIGINRLLDEARAIVNSNQDLSEFSIELGDCTHTYDSRDGWSSSYN